MVMFVIEAVPTHIDLSMEYQESQYSDRRRRQTSCSEHWCTREAKLLSENRGE
jgi:hypothetical protein